MRKQATLREKWKEEGEMIKQDQPKNDTPEKRKADIKAFINKFKAKNNNA